METNKKRILGVGAALAALFVGVSLNATPASALVTTAHANGLATPVFAHHDTDNRNRDWSNDDQNSRRQQHDYGNHNGWSKQNTKQAKEHEKWLREQAKRHRTNGGGQYYHRDGDNDRDDNNSNRNGNNSQWGQDHNWNWNHNGSSTWGHNQGNQNQPPPPPNLYRPNRSRNR